MYMKARDLFRLEAGTGQVGELLVYFLLETVLHAPQALKKMLMTSNPREERKGSDGVHLRWHEDTGVLELIFAESKLWKSFSDGLTAAFKSMDEFHDSRTKQLEINTVTAGFLSLSPELQTKVSSYIEGENASSFWESQACLIGFDWQEYRCLTDGRREKFVKEFENRYRNWMIARRDTLNLKLKNFKHKDLRFEFFILPFSDVEAFRNWFIEALTGHE
jgi:Cap4 SAVED domain